ncbi:MAG: hypothetical protein RL132_1187, partial [Pseudomonadota bacterium]
SDYSRFYSGEFSNSGHKDRASWLAFRKPRVMKEADIFVEIYGLKVTEQDSRHFVAEFVQDYKSGSLAVMSLVAYCPGRVDRCGLRSRNGGCRQSPSGTLRSLITSTC